MGVGYGGAALLPRETKFAEVSILFFNSVKNIVFGVGVEGGPIYSNPSESLPGVAHFCGFGYFFGLVRKCGFRGGEVRHRSINAIRIELTRLQIVGVCRC